MYATKLFNDSGTCLCADDKNTKLLVINGMGQSNETHPYNVPSPTEFLEAYNRQYEVEMTEANVFAADFLDSNGIPGASFEDADLWDWDSRTAQYRKRSWSNNDDNE